MKTLFLLRHAKSSWDDANLSDFERPLNERGLRTAPFMGKFVSEKGYEPSVIFSSTAERAKQTAIIVKVTANFECSILFDQRIYEAGPSALLQVTSEIANTHASAMLVGHNPGMEGFIRLLTGDLEPMPTAALAVIDLNIDNWNEIDDDCGQLQNVFRPKELTSM